MLEALLTLLFKEGDVRSRVECVSNEDVKSHRVKSVVDDNSKVIEAHSHNSMLANVWCNMLSGSRQSHVVDIAMNHKFCITSQFRLEFSQGVSGHS